MFHEYGIYLLQLCKLIVSLRSDLLFDEYLRQGDEERRLGMPISPYMDRNDTDQVKMSLNFVDFIGIPLFSTLVAAFPELHVCLETLKDNRKWWDARRELQKEKQKV